MGEEMGEERKKIIIDVSVQRTHARFPQLLSSFSLFFASSLPDEQIVKIKFTNAQDAKIEGMLKEKKNIINYNDPRF